MRLREYQLEATRACIRDLKKGYNPCITMATGTGKSVVICDVAAKLVSTYKKRVWVLTHNLKLTEQNHATWEKHFKFACRSGVVCSGLRPVGRWDFEESVIFGTIQTVENYAYRKTVHQHSIPSPDVIIVDEAHRVPMTPSGKSQYEKIFKLYPEAQRVAFTATPWRMDNGPICLEKTDGNIRSGSPDDIGSDSYSDRHWFDRNSFQYDVKRGVEEGYLAPLVGLNSELQLNLDEVTITGKGDYNKTELDRVMHRAEYDAWLVAVAKSLNQFEDRKFIAVYCTSVKIATRFAHLLWEHTNRKTCQVYGHHNKDQREKIFETVSSGRCNALVSVDMLTTGFDLPRLDTIVCLRPTLSSSLWVQIMGRGTRLAEGKTDCLVLDYVGNFMRLGGVQMMPNYKDEKSGELIQAQTPVKPHIKKERRVFPGVKTLEVVDPLTGEPATDNSIIKAKVHDCSGWVNGNVYYITVKYICETENGIRIDATQFIDTSHGRENNKAHKFFSRRRIIVRLPSNPRIAAYQIKDARRPNFVLLRRSPRNKAWWNVIKEIWTDE